MDVSANTTASTNATASTNEIVLVGRISGATEKELPSGDAVVTFRVIVDRPLRSRGPSGRVVVDAIDCCAWTVLLRRRVLGLAEGDVVELQGELRRRFWRTATGATSRVEVEARSLRRIRR